MHICYVFFAVPPTSHSGASQVAKIMTYYLVFTATIALFVTIDLDVVSAYFLSKNRTPVFSNGVVMSVVDSFPYKAMHFATYFLHCMIHGV